MNRGNTFTLCLVAGVIAVCMLVVPQAALAGMDRCCSISQGCITIRDCGQYHCDGLCLSGPCGSPTGCPAPTVSEEPPEDTDDEAFCPAAPHDPDASECEAPDESDAERTSGLELSLLLLLIAALPVG